jgi:predicted phage-related endonuclease
VLNEKRFKNGAFPDNYYVQCVHYMMVTGCKKWYLAVLVLGKEFRVYEIERDEEEIAALAQSEAEFWGYVEQQTPPPADGTNSTSETIATIYPESTDETVGLSIYERDLREYMSISAQIKALEGRKNEVANKVKAYMNTAGKGESESYRVSFASAERSTFDAKRFAMEHSNINLDSYYKKSTYRTFKVTEKGE